MPELINQTSAGKLRAQLYKGAKLLNLVIDKLAADSLLNYMALLLKWNKIHNLTAIRTPEEILIKHILDSLTALPLIKGQNVLDVGTGAGLPGIPLAILLPQYHFSLLDSNNKKTAFLTHTALALEIKNVNVISSRVEHVVNTQQPFTTIITRATMSTEALLNKTKHIALPDTCYLIMKGKNPQKELQNIKKSFTLERVQVPFLSEERHIIRSIT